ncbi:MAG: HEAT repeat domain-containing protein [Planctomycetes bacterium]|nr:HEAT repeat domain-containing protein [Planctomycetota bacterium]
MMSAATAALFAAVFISLQNSPAAGTPKEIVTSLGSPEPSTRAKAFQLLKDGGPAGIAAAFAYFNDANPIARELLAKCLRESGDIGALDALVPYLNDPNPLVRLEFVNYLSRPDFALGKGDERAAQLLKFAADAEFSVRAAAIKGLLRLARPSATAEMIKSIRGGDSLQRDGLLRALGMTAGAADELLTFQNWVDGAGINERGLWLVELGFTGDTRVLPTLKKYARHPTEGAAALSGFDLLIQRLVLKRRDAELLEVLDAWSEIDPVDVAWRRLRYHLIIQCDLGAARTAAAKLDAAAALEGPRRREWRAIASSASAICDIADGMGAAAEEKLERAFQFAAGQRASGVDDAEDEGALLLLARIRVLSAFNAVFNKFDGSPDPRARLESAYEYFKLRVFESIARSLQGLWQRQDAKLRNNVIMLIMQGRSWSLSANWNFDPALESDVGMLTAISTVIPKRGRGTEALAAGVRILDILSDVNPREFVTSKHSQDWQNFTSPFVDMNIGRVQSVPISPVRVTVDMPVCGLTRSLGQVARSILGDMRTAADLLEPVIERASQGALTSTSEFATYVDASLERSGVAMDAGEPDVADQYIFRVLERLDQVKKTYEELFDSESVKVLGAATAETRTTQAKLWLDLERRLRAQTLISRAVNENVVKGQPETAARYAKEGVALDPTEFNKVVLACYLAREGNVTEARAVLRDASDSLGTYYNLSCTYALLGEADTAIVYLERDFQEHADKGGLERQRAWARKDPDLKSLRSDPRFQALTNR